VPQTHADTLQLAREAYERHEWREAFDALREADSLGALDAEDLERLAECAWWSGRQGPFFDALQRAYAAHLERGATAGAGMIALTLAKEYQTQLAQSVATGWFQRARALLEQVPDTREHGYLVLARAMQAHAEGELERARELAGRAAELARRFGDHDLEAYAVQAEGRTLIAAGDVAAGLPLVDEATLRAVAGELGTLATANVYCRTIGICRELADYGRAGEWTEAAARWCDRQAITGFPGVCRVHRAEVLRLRGALVDAEREARRAHDELREFVPSVAGESLYEVGEIRLRMGDLPGAEEAFREAAELGRDPQPGLALLRLAQGGGDAAAAGIRRALTDEPWDRLARARLLPAQVEIALETGDRASARAAADELQEIAGTYHSRAIEAAAATAVGAVQLAAGDAAAARELRRGAQLWRELDMPYEAAKCRALLGLAYRASGDGEAAALELRTAGAAFERLGAVRDAARVAALLEADHAPPDAAARTRRTFVFTDMCRSTQLVEAIGDDAWRDLVRWHDATLRGRFTAHRGEVVKQAGDGFFVAFGDVGEAVACAVEIQRALAEHRRTHGFAPQVRIGLHAADAERVDGDYRGRGVHEAARIGALAEGGQILASRSTLDGVALPHPVGAPQSVRLKGLTDPVEVVAVEWRAAGAPASQPCVPSSTAPAP
jgi:class 3 adenylate cyclase